MIGKTVSHYKILEKLGQGGMGIVYKAQDTKLDRFVALKFLPPHISENEEEKKRFIQEAKAASALQHHNICTIHEINETDDEQLFLCMDYYEGETLKDKIESGPLEEEETINIAVQIAQGLAKAHEKGIVHRDIKPANIMITDDGVVKILDFGLAKLAGQTKLTKSGSTLGTVAYMSPEQARSEQVDHRTDIWSLGVLFFEMLSGQLPYKGEYEHAIIYSIINEDAESLSVVKPDVSQEISQIVEKALIKEPDNRYLQANDLLKDIQKLAKKLELGISEEIEISGRFSFFKRLYQKRVPQILAVYFVFIFLLVQFVDWITNRFLLSPHLINFSLLALLTLIPAVVMLTYFRKAPKQQSWFSIGKLGVSLNLIVSIMILFMGFGDKDLGLLEETKTVIDENGNTREIKAPKIEYCNSVALFPFENTNKDTAYDWLQRGFNYMLFYDLLQDHYINGRRAYDGYPHDPNYNSKERINDAGFPNGVGLSLKFKSTISKELFQRNFLTGTFNFQNEEYHVTTQLYETDNTKFIKEHTYSGTNIFTIADSISLDLRYVLNIPKNHIENSEDLPVAEMLTNSGEAFKAFMIGFDAFENDLPDKAESFLKKSLSIDSTLTVAYDFLGNLTFSRDEEIGMKYREKSFFYINKLPKYLQRIQKAYKYWSEGNKENQLKQIELRAIENPFDLIAQEGLVGIYKNKSQWNMAINQYKDMLRIAPENYRFVEEIAKIYKNTGDYDKAREYYEDYKNKYSEDYRPYLGLAEISRLLGKSDEAISYLIEAEFNLIGNTNLVLWEKLIEIEISLGRMDKALEKYNQLLSNSKTLDDSLMIYRQLADYYQLRGQIRESLKIRDWRAPRVFKQQNILIDRANVIYAPMFAAIGQKDKAIEIIQKIIKNNKPSWRLDQWIPYGYVCSYLVSEEVDSIEKYIQIYDQKYASTTRSVTNKKAILFAKGKVPELREEYDQALERYQEKLKRYPTDVTIHIHIGRVYRKQKDYKKAEEALKKTLLVEPFNPEALYEIALCYWEWNKKDLALENLTKCLFVWEKADAEYIPAQKAKEKLAEWEKAE